MSRPLTRWSLLLLGKGEAGKGADIFQRWFRLIEKSPFAFPYSCGQSLSSVGARVVKTLCSRSSRTGLCFASHKGTQLRQGLCRTRQKYKYLADW